MFRTGAVLARRLSRGSAQRVSQTCSRKGAGVAGRLALASQSRALGPRLLSSSTTGATELVRDLRAAVDGDEKGLLLSPSDMGPYCTDWLGEYGCMALAVARPQTTQQVSAVLAACHRAGVPVVPQGGNTGLVGGGVPVAAGAEVLLSLDRMTGVRSFDEDAGVLTVEAGAVLQRVDEMLRSDHGRCMPVDLGAKGSCTVGGIIATAAGGVHAVRWGSLHSSLVGVEAVLADGTVVDGLSSARKRNMGYHWPHLMLGSEGTLGVVTAAALRVPPAPEARVVAMLGFADWDGLRRTVRRALGSRGLAETVSAAEYLDAASVDVAVTWGGQRDPLDERYPYTLLLEAAGASQAYCSERMEEVAQGALAAGEAITGAVSASTAQARQMWGLREGVTEALSKRGRAVKLDVSLPLERMAGPRGAVAAARGRLRDQLDPAWLSPGPRGASTLEEGCVAGGWGCDGTDVGGVLACGYGHVGDGNLHLNVSVPSACAADGRPVGAEGDTLRRPPASSSAAAPPPSLAEAAAAARDASVPFVPEWVAREAGMRGSVSAEHGVGMSKLGYAGLSRGSGEEALMRRLKAALDPTNTLLPGRVLAARGR